MQPSSMTLRVQLPFQVFAEQTHVLRIVAETADGSFGLLPRRRDVVAALTPGILTYETKTNGEAYIAVDAGVLVKTGPEVRVAVRRAIAGADLGRLREEMAREFMNLDEQERSVRSVLAKLESGFIRRFASMKNG